MTTGTLMTMSGVMDPRAKTARTTTRLTVGQRMRIDTIMFGKDAAAALKPGGGAA